MSDDADDAEIETSPWFPYFYPASQSNPPDPTSIAARLYDELQADPLATESLATELPAILLHTARTHPAYIDHTLHAIKILCDKPSLPLIDNWPNSGDKTTFVKMFDLSLAEDLNNAIRELRLSQRKSYIGASLLGGRARSIEVFDTPDLGGGLAEGLRFDGEVRFTYEGDMAEIAAIGSCLQLLGSASRLNPERFAKDKILSALKNLQLEFSRNALIKFTITHLQKEPLIDLTSQQIVDDVSWVLPGDGEGNDKAIVASSETLKV